MYSLLCISLLYYVIIACHNFDIIRYELQYERLPNVTRLAVDHAGINIKHHEQQHHKIK
jgi:hypothetical protein